MINNYKCGNKCHVTNGLWLFGFWIFLAQSMTLANPFHIVFFTRFKIYKSFDKTQPSEKRD